MRPRLTYANLMASIAVFIALGGTSFAAMQLGKGEVKRKNIAPNAINSSKVKDGSLLRKDFKPGELVAGSPGSSGAVGPVGPQGPQGPKGDTGDAGPLLDVMPPGETLRGRWSIDFAVPPGITPTISDTTTVSYLFPMPEALATHIGFGTLPADVCPVDDGIQGAAPGHLCVRVTGKLAQGTPPEIPPDPTVASADTLGFQLNLAQGATEPGRYQATGTWAATAPDAE